MLGLASITTELVVEVLVEDDLGDCHSDASGADDKDIGVAFVVEGAAELEELCALLSY